MPARWWRDRCPGPRSGACAGWGRLRAGPPPRLRLLSQRENKISQTGALRLQATRPVPVPLASPSGPGDPRVPPCGTPTAAQGPRQLQASASESVRSRAGSCAQAHTQPFCLPSLPAVPRTALSLFPSCGTHWAPALSPSPLLRTLVTRASAALRCCSRPGFREPPSQSPGRAPELPSALPAAKPVHLGSWLTCAYPSSSPSAASPWPVRRLPSPRDLQSDLEP